MSSTPPESTSPDTAMAVEEPAHTKSLSEDEEEMEEDGSAIEPILDGRNITFKTRILNQYLLCSLCMGYFKDAHTIMECLHTFCKSCIYKYFLENSECPTCGISLKPFPMQTIRVDRTLQSIVDKIFPQLLLKDLQEEKFFYVERGLPIPDALLEEENKAAPSIPTVDNQPPPSKRLKKGEAHKRIYNDEIAFELSLDAACTDIDLPKLDKPFIRTSAKITVFHLKKFLSKKLNLKTANEVEITYRGEVLGSEHSLEYILKTRGMEPNGIGGPLFIYRKKTVHAI